MMPMDWIDYLKSHPLIDQSKLQRVETAVRTLWDKIMKRELPAYKLVN